MGIRASPRKRCLVQVDTPVDCLRYAQDATQSSQEYAFLDSPKDPYFLPSEPETSEVSSQRNPIHERNGIKHTDVNTILESIVLYNYKRDQASKCCFTYAGALEQG